MAEAKTYGGGCHCGNVRYEVDVELREVLECNCSICSKAGSRLTSSRRSGSGCSPSGSAFGLPVPIEDRPPPLCPSADPFFARGKGPGGGEMIAINVHCREDFDASASASPFDGRSL